MKKTEDNGTKETAVQAQTEDWYSWYQQFDRDHTLEQRREWYSQAANAYRQARPRYPQTVLDSVVNQANLTPASRLLELGCGPGIATADLAPKGFFIQAVEPSPAACELARQACQSYKKVAIANNTFEDWPLPTQKFDAVLAATSFHWISREVACKKSAAALKPEGSLILLWATPPQPDSDILKLIQPVYEQFNLGELGKEQHRSQAYYQHNFKTFAETIGSSGYFKTSPVECITQHSIYSVEKYIALLSTLSGYIKLAPEIRDELFDAIAQKLTSQLTTRDLETTHHFAHQVAPHRPFA